MKNIQCYIATSIDGYIARKDNSIDWLDIVPVPEGSGLGYTAFYNNVDVVIMGRNTYDEVMGFGVPWPYADSQCFIVTSDINYKVQTPNTQLVHSVDQALIEKLKNVATKNIWLIGGGGLVSQFMKLNALNELLISIIPIVLGDGIRLFPDNPPETQFDLKKIDDFGNGAVMLSYLKKDA